MEKNPPFLGPPNGSPRRPHRVAPAAVGSTPLPDLPPDTTGPCRSSSHPSHLGTAIWRCPKPMGLGVHPVIIGRIFPQTIQLWGKPNFSSFFHLWGDCWPSPNLGVFSPNPWLWLWEILSPVMVDWPMGNFKKSSIQKIQENEGITHNLSMFFEHLQALKTVNSPSKIGTRV